MKKHHLPSHPSPLRSTSSQGGMVLVVCLLLLLILTIIGIASVGNVNMQTQMARNTQFNQEVFQMTLSEMKYQFQRLRGGTTAVIPIADIGNALFNPGVPVAVADQDVASSYVAAASGVNMPVTVLYTGTDSSAMVTPGCSGGTVHKFVVNANATVSGTPFGSDQSIGIQVCVQ